MNLSIEMVPRLSLVIDVMSADVDMSDGPGIGDMRGLRQQRALSTSDPICEDDHDPPPKAAVSGLTATGESLHRSPVFSNSSRSRIA